MSYEVNEELPPLKVIDAIDKWVHNQTRLHLPDTDEYRYMLTAVASAIKSHSEAYAAEKVKEARGSTARFYDKELKHWKDLAEILMRERDLKTEPNMVVVTQETFDELTNIDKEHTVTDNKATWDKSRKAITKSLGLINSYDPRLTNNSLEEK